MWSGSSRVVRLPSPAPFHVRRRLGSNVGPHAGGCCGYSDLSPTSDPPRVLQCRTSDRVETCFRRSSSLCEDVDIGILVLRISQEGGIVAASTTTKRKLILKMSVCLDGFVAGPNGEVDWIFRTMGGDSKSRSTR